MFVNVFIVLASLIQRLQNFPNIDEMFFLYNADVSLSYYCTVLVFLLARIYTSVTLDRPSFALVKSACI